MGARSVTHPDGGRTPLDRKVLGNKQAAFMCHICKMLHSVGGVFTIENLMRSFLWKAKSLLKLYQEVPCYVVFLQQCMYGLKTLGFGKSLVSAKKKTKFMTILLTIAMIPTFTGVLVFCRA